MDEEQSGLSVRNRVESLLTVVQVFSRQVPNASHRPVHAGALTAVTGNLEEALLASLADGTPSDTEWPTLWLALMARLSLLTRRSSHLCLVGALPVSERVDDASMSFADTLRRCRRAAGRLALREGALDSFARLQLDLCKLLARHDFETVFTSLLEPFFQILQPVFESADAQLPPLLVRALSQTIDTTCLLWPALTIRQKRRIIRLLSTSRLIISPSAMPIVTSESRVKTSAAHRELAASLITYAASRQKVQAGDLLSRLEALAIGLCFDSEAPSTIVEICFPAKKAPFTLQGDKYMNTFHPQLARILKRNFVRCAELANKTWDLISEGGVPVDAFMTEASQQLESKDEVKVAAAVRLLARAPRHDPKRSVDLIADLLARCAKSTQVTLKQNLLAGACATASALSFPSAECSKELLDTITNLLRKESSDALKDSLVKLQATLLSLQADKSPAECVAQWQPPAMLSGLEKICQRCEGINEVKNALLWLSAQLTSATNKVGQRIFCARAWCVALTLCQRFSMDEELKETLLTKENMKFLSEISTTLFAVSGTELCSEERARVTIELVRLLISNEKLLADLWAAGDACSVLQTKAVGTSGFVAALADTMVNLRYWQLNAAGGRETGAVIDRTLAETMRPSKALTVRLLESVLLRALNEGGPALGTARRLTVRNLLDRCAVPASSLSALLGDEMAMGVILFYLHPDSGSYSHARGPRLLMRAIRKSRHSNIKLHIPTPPTRCRELLAEYLGDPLKGSFVSHFVKCMSEKNLRRWSNLLEGVHDAVNIRAWHDLFKEVCQRDLVKSLNLANLAKLAKREDFTVVASKSTPPPSSQPRAKAKARASPAAARLVEKETAEVSSLATEKNAMQQKCLRICETAGAMAEAWPALVAADLPALVADLRLMMHISLSALPACALMRTLVNIYVPIDRVPHKRELAECLYAISGPHHKNVSQVGAEEICKALSETKPLDAETSAFVLPIILNLLSSEKGASLFAVHRAVSVLSNQLRLGAQLHSTAVLDCTKAVLKSHPGLMPLCSRILSTLPALVDFKGDEHGLVLSEYLETDSVRLRRNIATILSQKVVLTAAAPLITTRLFVLSFDADESCRKLATDALSENPHHAGFVQHQSEALLDLVIERLGSESAVFRKLCGRALAGYWPKEMAKSVSKIIHAYAVTFRPQVERPVELHLQGFELKAGDQAWVVKEPQDSVDQLSLSNCGRLGCVSALAALVGTSSIQFQIQEQILDFLINTALTTKTMDATLEADIQSVAIKIASNNTEHPTEMVDYVLEIMSAPNLKNKTDPAVCVLVLLVGTQTKHISVEDARLITVLQVLRPILLSNQTSLKVKRAVARVLPTLLNPLFITNREDKESLMAEAKKSAVEERDVKVRVGGALLLAAIVKAGTLNPKFESLLDDLSTLARDRKEVWSRHGAFLCFEALIDALGKLIETHAVRILPVLLSGLADMQAVVREASGIVARKLMACLSNHELRLVLPELIKVAKSPSWRSKVGAIELLGNVASVSPSHLSVVLAQVIPVLTEAAHDSHKEVKQVAARAITSLSVVVESPELREMIDEVLACLTEASDKVVLTFFDKLIDIEFEHYLDSAALSFIAVAVTRGLTAIKSDTRLKAAQVLAVLPSVIRDPETEFGPHAKSMMNYLKQNLNDPMPEVRQATARCLGILSAEVGSVVYGDAVAYLIKTLKTTQGSVERSGAANALVEVFHALGPAMLTQHLPDIIRQADLNPKPGVREGFMGLFVYMPLIYKDDFQDFVPQVLPTLLNGLAAEEEPVRDIAYRASKIFVQQYGASHTPLLLQPLEKALFHPAVEVRLRAVSLLGGLVDKILKGVENSTAEGGQLMQLEILSLERRAYILSALFLARSDVELEVRQTASAVWKTVVQNTPRTVRELLPILTKRLLDLLASEESIKEETAGRCMEELVMKHGDKLLPQVMTIFVDTLKGKPEPRAARGVFIGLQAIVTGAPRSVLKTYASQLNPLIRRALIETEDREVRRQVVQVVNIMMKAEEKEKDERISSAKGRAGRGAPPRDIAGGEVRSFTEPILLDYFDPPVYRDSEIDDRRRGMLNTIEIFLESQVGDMVGEILALCRKGRLDITKVRALGAISQANFAPHLSAVLAALLRAFTPAALACDSKEEDSEAVPVAEVQDALKRICEALPREATEEEILPLVHELIVEHRSRLSVSASSWRSIFDKDNSFESLETLDQHALLRCAEKLNLKVEADPSQPVSRAFAVAVVGALLNGAEDAADWFKSAGVSLLDKIVPTILSDCSTAVSQQALFFMTALLKASTRDMLVLATKPIYQGLMSCLMEPALDPSIVEKIRLPGLQHKVLLEAVSSVLQAGLLYGAADTRASSAQAIRLITRAADATILSSAAIKATGPLIRVFADRVSSNIKQDVLEALITLLTRTGTNLRPIMPQMQSTFVRCLSDPSDEDIRLLAAKALRKLAAFAGPRADLLVRELSKTLQNSSGSMSTTLEAIRGVLEIASKDVQAGTKVTVKEIVASLDESAVYPQRAQILELLQGK